MDTIKKLGKVIGKGIGYIIIILVSAWIIGTSLTVIIGHLQESPKLSDRKDIVSIFVYHKKCASIVPPCKLPPECVIQTYYQLPTEDQYNALEDFSRKFNWPCDIYRLLAILAASIFFYKSCQKLAEKLCAMLD